MIYTVTMNPSLDYVMVFKEAKLGTLNRASREMHLLGGKGINISIVLKNYQIASTCLGFIAGYIGNEIEQGLTAYGCGTDFIRVSNGCTRINVKMKEAWGQETELNGNGPDIGEAELEKLAEKVSGLSDGDTLILSGNVPQSVSKNIYARLAEISSKKRIQLVVDAERELLLPTLPFRPLLIKPNHIELGEILGKKKLSEADIMSGAQALQKMGARNILVSRGNAGAYFLGEDGTETFFEAPKGTVINTIGAGDSMVAGFLSYYGKGYPLLESARYAVASGSARAFSELLPQKEKSDQLYSRIKTFRVQQEQRV
jgi:1-phosphofructokinase